MPSFPSLPSTKWHMCVYKKEQDTLWWRFLGQVTVSIELCNYSTSIHINPVYLASSHSNNLTLPQTYQVEDKLTSYFGFLHSVQGGSNLSKSKCHTLMVEHTHGAGNGTHISPSLGQTNGHCAHCWCDSLHVQLCVNILALITCKPRRYLTNTTHL